MFKWEKGQENTGYYRMVLFHSKKLQCEIALVKFPEMSYQPKKIDIFPKKENYRLNFTLKHAKSGGLMKLHSRHKGFKASHTIGKDKRKVLFRPDIGQHEICRVTKGSRYDIYLGWTKNKNKKEIEKELSNKASKRKKKFNSRRVV